MQGCTTGHDQHNHCHASERNNALAQMVPSGHTTSRGATQASCTSETQQTNNTVGYIEHNSRTTQGSQLPVCTHVCTHSVRDCQSLTVSAHNNPFSLLLALTRGSKGSPYYPWPCPPCSKGQPVAATVHQLPVAHNTNYVRAPRPVLTAVGLLNCPREGPDTQSPADSSNAHVAVQATLYSTYCNCTS